MKASPLVAIYCQVYNTEQYLPQCIESVLSQTYSNFRFTLIDNASTDRSADILRDYAARDDRIRLIHMVENTRAIWLRTAWKEKNSEYDYLANIDSDDWWEPDYLEQLIFFLEQNDLDLAVTGTYQYIEDRQISQIMRKLEHPIVLTQRQFAQNYPAFWTFPSTGWGCVMKVKLYQKTDVKNVTEKRYPFGTDTMATLQYIKQCSRIGIDNSALYHYRIHPQGLSCQYSPRRFDANIACYEQIKDFLELHHTFDYQKQEWLKRVHLFSMIATLNLLRDSALSDNEKLNECVRIVTHPLTATALTNDCSERKQWFDIMWEIVLSTFCGGKLCDGTNLDTVLRFLAPQCCGAVQVENLTLFVREPALWKALRKDDREQLTDAVLGLISRKQYTKQYDLGKMLYAVIPEDSLLSGTSDTRFFREYAAECALILKSRYLDALDGMTGLLLQRKKLYDEERFLNLYLTIAAMTEQTAAFVFGKLQLARFYLKANRLPECRGIVEDLMEAGVDNDEMDELRRELEAAKE